MIAPGDFTALDLWHRRAQRSITRRKCESNRRRRQLARCDTLSAPRTCIRWNFKPRVALSVFSRLGIVNLEDLNVCAMTARATGAGVRQEAGPNRMILNAV